jgi:hypothetical protein
VTVGAWATSSRAALSLSEILTPRVATLVKFGVHPNSLQVEAISWTTTSRYSRGRPRSSFSVGEQAVFDFVPAPACANYVMMRVGRLGSEVAHHDRVIASSKIICAVEREDQPGGLLDMTARVGYRSILLYRYSSVTHRDSFRRWLI